MAISTLGRVTLQEYNRIVAHQRSVESRKRGIFDIEEAYRMGLQAAMAGRPTCACPFPRRSSGRWTDQWLEGWREGDRMLEDGRNHARLVELSLQKVGLPYVKGARVH